ncbi:hypothetical protein IAU60_003867 [Kwoniella sp. DSM 27419]
MLHCSAFAFALSITYTAALASQVCNPDTCIDGSSSCPLLSKASPGARYLTPGTYAGIESSLGSDMLNVTRNADGFSIQLPSVPVGFTSPHYSRGEDPWTGLGWSMPQWKSVYLPTEWYAVLNGGQVIWGAVPVRQELPNDLTGRAILRAASSACDPPCSSRGICSARNGSAVCECAAGWTGIACKDCAQGYWGTECSPGPSGCSIWDDGYAGSGACIGTSSTSSDTCQCDHGKCLSSTECACSAGWTTNTTISGSLCNVCAEGFYLDGFQNCSACPLGCKTCGLEPGSDTPTCTSCQAGLTLSSSYPASCAAQGSCDAGSYFDPSDSTCKGCSPACSTCTGPAPSDCLACASPRVNLQGQCVHYDPTTAKCDSSLSNLQGVFIVNNEKSRCDACPAGCLDCSIPDFSNVQPFSDLRCAACQQGWLLQDGRCVRICDPGWYLPQASAGGNGTCQKCDSSCTTCQSAATICTACPPPLFAHQGSCDTTCPTDTLPLNGTCTPCPVDCASCSSLTQCTACPSSRPILKNGRCVEYCPSDQYFDSARQTCQACDWHCASCSAPGQGSCTSCADGYKLRRGRCLPADCPNAFVPGYGVCLSDLVDGRTDARWFGFFALAGVVLAAGVAFRWYILNQRRRTRQATRTFGQKLDERQVRGQLRTLRLERVLGLERVRTSESGLEPSPWDGVGRGTEERYDEGRKRRFKQLWQPARRKGAPGNIEMSTRTREDGEVLAEVAPPPYVASYGDYGDPERPKQADSSLPVDRKLGESATRDSVDSLPTPILPSFLSSPIYGTSGLLLPSSSTTSAETYSSKATPRGPIIHSMSDPSPEFAAYPRQGRSLMPPPRPTLSSTNDHTLPHPRRERPLTRDVVRAPQSGADQEMEGTAQAARMEMRLRELWPNMPEEQGQRWTDHVL